jgi:hypothetical protein
MAGVFPTFLEELEARTAIEDCLKRFARAVDRQDWKAARQVYHDGAFDDHGFFMGPPGGNFKAKWGSRRPKMGEKGWVTQYQAWPRVANNGFSTN